MRATSLQVCSKTQETGVSGQKFLQPSSSPMRSELGTAVRRQDVHLYNDLAFDRILQVCAQRSLSEKVKSPASQRTPLTEPQALPSYGPSNASFPTDGSAVCLDANNTFSHYQTRAPGQDPTATRAINGQINQSGQISIGQGCPHAIELPKIVHKQVLFFDESWRLQGTLDFSLFLGIRC